MIKFLIRSLADNLLLWFNAIAVDGVLPLSHKLFIMYLIYNRLLDLLFVYVCVSIVIACLIDIVLRNEKLRIMMSNFLKKYCTPEIFKIYGNNPGDMAFMKIAGQVFTGKAGITVVKTVGYGMTADHLLTHTGVYDSISYKANISSGMTNDQAMSRLSKNRVSVIESLIKYK